MWGEVMSEIHVSVVDQVLKITKAPQLASGGVNEVKVIFDFCEKWNGFAKTALFYRDTEKLYYAVLDMDDTCVVPWEVCAADGAFFFAVFGEKGITRRTSNTVRYKVTKGIVASEFTPSDPTPEVYDQILALLAENNDATQGFITGASSTLEAVQKVAANLKDAVLYTKQTLTEAQKAQARENIGAVGTDDVCGTLNPDMFAGTDTEKIQACFNELSATGGIIAINRKYTLDNNITLTHNSDDSHLITMAGMGKNASIDCASFGFIADPSGNIGGIRFCDINLYGTGTLIDGNDIMRVFFDGCFLHGFKHIIYGTEHAQTMHFYNCQIRSTTDDMLMLADGSTGSFAGLAFDFKMSNCLVEWCYGLFNARRAWGCAITNNCIEGFPATPIVIRGLAAGLSICDNYFEANAGANSENPNIDFTSIAEGSTVTVQGNHFAEYTVCEAIKMPCKFDTGSLYIVGNHNNDPASYLLGIPDDADSLKGVFVFANSGRIKDDSKKLATRSIDDINTSLTYNEQKLTSNQQTQVRKNINSANIASEFVSQVAGEKITIDDVANDTLQNICVFGKSICDGVPTIESPANIKSSGDNGSVTLAVCGRNLFGGELLANAITNVNHSSVTKIDTAEGTVSFHWNGWDAESVIFDKFSEGKQYTIILRGNNSQSTDNPGTNLRIKYTDGTYESIHFDSSNPTTKFLTNESKTVEALVGAKYGGTTTLYYSDCGVFEGDISEAEFEPCALHTIDIPFANNFGGVPVASGGNYVDANGVQWLSDGIDCERGIFASKIEFVEYDGSNDEEWVYVEVDGYPTVEYAYVKLGERGSVVGDAVLCNRFSKAHSRITTANQQTGVCVYNHEKNGAIFVMRTGVSEVTDIDTLRTWLNEHPITIAFAKAKAVETPLPTEVLDMYKASKASVPYTTISANEDVGISVQYIPKTQAGQIITDLLQRVAALEAHTT